MKRFICALLVAALSLCALTGCDRKTVTPEPAAEQQADFAPETTAAGFAGADLPATVPETEPTEAAEAPAEQPVAQDSALDPTDSEAAEPETTPEPAETPEAASEPTETQQAASLPFATATPQPNTSIAGYTEVDAGGLGFRFSYPTGWTNIPGRSTVCFVQPTENGTVYPARVAVTMKKLAHRCNYDSNNEHKTELADYLKTLMTQYDEKTFKVNTTLDEETRFMDNSAISTTYLAYDGDQEIQGYVILTYFERYLFVYHFLCAYEDYAAFEPAMRHMRDSVKAAQDLLD